MNDELISKGLLYALKYAAKKMVEYNEETQGYPNWNNVDDPVVGPGMHYD